MNANDSLFSPDKMICPAKSIFDAERVNAALKLAILDAPDHRAIRSAAVEILGDAKKNGNEAISAALSANPFNAHSATRAYAYLADCIVSTAFDLATQTLHPQANPTESERICVLAVGGSGRAEMAPYSDIDLLFLTPYKITAWAESVIESMLYVLWDLRLKVGYASRTIADCIRLGREDFTIRTSLVEQRYIAGQVTLAIELEETLWNDLFSKTAKEFIEAKLEERDQRHEKQGGQRYVVEPNIKEGKGGLRDLQSLFWIAKYLHRVNDVQDLVGLKWFTEEEYQSFQKAENFLWAARCHLHLTTNRAMETLNFDLQVEVAKRMHYTDHDGRRAVEYFMQDYFRHATHVGDLTRIFVTKLEAQHLKQEPILARIFKRKKKVKAGYKVVQNRLAILNETSFLADNLNILRLYEEALRTGLLIHPDAMRLISANLDLIDDDMRSNKEAVRIFIGLLLKHGNPERALRRMNELGVLAAFLPEFEPIVAMMQFNMYHHYTVDEHTIQCISNLAQIEREELIEELPIASGILKTGVNRKVLYLALLFHDIGKGRDEAHEILGARIAEKAMPRLFLKPDEAKTVKWLVRHHLLMSDVAQKRDISDPRTIRGFAKMVKTKERLDLLTVLTVCDIRGVGPDTWNNWKAMLIRRLYSDTETALENGMEAVNRTARESAAKSALRQALGDWGKSELKTETKRHYSPYWQGLQTNAHVIFAKHLRGLTENEIRIDLKPDNDRDATQACFTLADHPGIFSRVAGALALVGANVVDARSYTTKDGFVTAVFWVQDADGHPYEKSRLNRLRTMIGKTLKGEVITGDALQSRDKIKKRERAFKVPTTITFDNEGSEIYTIIEVDTRDRAALLFDLTRTLSNANIYIASAVIATYGEQVVDTFYVKDMFGLKLHDKKRQAILETRLKDAIKAGHKRAQAQ